MSVKEGLLSRRTVLPAAVISASALIITGCGNDDETARDSSSRTSAHSTTTGPTMEFDYLGARSQVIRVYESPADGATEPNGTYYDGDTVTALCKEDGREVRSKGDEIDRTSSEWIYFEDSNKVGHFATAVYVAQPEALLASLDDC